MSHALFTRSVLAGLGFCLVSSASMAGGYGGGANGVTPIASQEAQAILSYADAYNDGHFKVRHQEAAGAYASTDGNGETAYGYGSSDTDMESGTGVTSWKRSVQRSNGSAENGSASAGGFSASFVKIRTGDGRYYMFKGYASTGASVGPGGSSTSQTGLAKSVGGRY
jgi:hypothetical protein